MRYCEIPFRKIYIDFQGQTWMCPWNNGTPIGYITDGIEKVWHSEAANEVRRSILDGSFSRCRKDACPYFMNNMLPERPENTLEELTLPFPDSFELAYDYVCNLSCPSCRKQPIYGSKNAQSFFDNVQAQIQPHLSKMSFLSVSGHGDPLFSKHSLGLLERLHPERPDAVIKIQTNGVMFTPQIWKKIEHLGNHNLQLIVSVETLNPYVYAKLRCGGNFDALHKNLRFMSGLRQQGKIKKMQAVMVVQDLNFMEMPLFAKYCTDLNFDVVAFENLYNWGTFTEKDYFTKNLLNPLHPQHNFFKELLDEVIQDKRVICFAGKTNRVASRFSVIGTSQCVISEITPEDTIDAEAKFFALADAIYNKGYIFILKDGMYLGTYLDSDFYTHRSNPANTSLSAGELCNKGYTAIHDTPIETILQNKQTYIGACQTVFPIIREGKLSAKMLIEK